jgi:hypothetical protein
MCSGAIKAAWIAKNSKACIMIVDHLEKGWVGLHIGSIRIEMVLWIWMLLESIDRSSGG